ncbi:MAG: hypothetical protein CYPHOPRED_005388 [Cyphobasidiales sp. Tagirdzhanova-0007]|nr:MAG: hypothetical protein CYPHOPRED_005388 [Cyphobasidiales sp. Tagirdzhanova-0007]
MHISNLQEVEFSLPKDALSKNESVAWDRWVAGSPEKKAGWLECILKRMIVYQAAPVDDEDIFQVFKSSTEQIKRSLVFPPMHRIPSELTVLDLKENRREEGSYTPGPLTTVEAFRDLLQIVGLGVTFALPRATSDSFSTQVPASSSSLTAKILVLSIIPSVLGLDFVSAFGKANVWLCVFCIICIIACWEFREMVGAFGRPLRAREDLGEGLDFENASGRAKVSWIKRVRKSRVWKISKVFLLTSLYVPQSKLSIGALPLPLGEADLYLDPLDFCYRTTMRRSGLNLASPILILAATIMIVTISFPVRLWQVVYSQIPKVDPYTELGERRIDVKSEYNRILENDNSPLSFIYQVYRGSWAGFKSAYMALKLVSVLGVTVFTKDNCLFRSRTRNSMNVIQQATNLGWMVGWLALQVYARPFSDPLSNNSDWCSRVAYVIIALLGLASPLDLPGKAAYSGGLFVGTTVLSYLVNGYFTFIGTDVAQRLVQRWQERLDFSIDLFSPNLDVAKHIIRRIQQETISTLLLAEPEYRISSADPLCFGSAAVSGKTNEGPPYLLGFQGTQGERHIENIKILSEVGLQEATLLPFPFTLVFRYDESNTTLTLIDRAGVKLYVEQNASHHVKAGRRTSWVAKGLFWRKANVGSPAYYDTGVLQIKRNSAYMWRGYNYNSGFHVSLVYSNGKRRRPDGTLDKGMRLEIDHDDLGITPDFRLTSKLAQLFQNNRRLIESHKQDVERKLDQHRAFFAREAEWKSEVLSYDFLIDVYGSDKPSTKAMELTLSSERSEAMRNLIGSKGFFHNGILNRIYFYLNEAVLNGTHGSISLRVGRRLDEVDFHELDNLNASTSTTDGSFGRKSKGTLDTGQGTDHDGSTMRDRRHFLFEQIYDYDFAKTSANKLNVLKQMWQKMRIKYQGMVGHEQQRKFCLRAPPALTTASAAGFHPLIVSALAVDMDEPSTRLLSTVLFPIAVSIKGKHQAKLRRSSTLPLCSLPRIHTSMKSPAYIVALVLVIFASISWTVRGESAIPLDGSNREIHRLPNGRWKRQGKITAPSSTASPNSGSGSDTSPDAAANASPAAASPSETTSTVTSSEASPATASNTKPKDDPKDKAPAPKTQTKTKTKQAKPENDAKTSSAKPSGTDKDKSKPAKSSKSKKSAAPQSFVAPLATMACSALLAMLLMT